MPFADFISIRKKSLRKKETDILLTIAKTKKGCLLQDNPFKTVTYFLFHYHYSFSRYTNFFLWFSYSGNLFFRFFCIFSIVFQFSY